MYIFTILEAIAQTQPVQEDPTFWGPLQIIFFLEQVVLQGPQLDILLCINYTPMIWIIFMSVRELFYKSKRKCKLR